MRHAGVPSAKSSSLLSHRAGPRASARFVAAGFGGIRRPLCPGPALPQRQIPAFESDREWPAVILDAMIKGRPAHARTTPARAPRGAWSLLRGLFLMLMASHWTIFQLAPGRARRAALRILARHVGALEHGLRCLLILMRAAPVAAPPFPGLPTPSNRRSVSALARQQPARFSLSLARLAQGFAQRGAPLNYSRKSLSRPCPQQQAAPASPSRAVSPADAIGARLQAMRAVFDDPHRHAAKLAAILRAGGLIPHRAKPLIPSAALWQLICHTAASPAPSAPPRGPNTS